MKIQEDITFIKKCKLENIIHTFAKVKLSIKSGNTKLHKRIARIVMETELQNKHQQKKKIKKEISSISFQLKNILGLYVYHAMFHHINIAVKSRRKSIRMRHGKKSVKFRQRQNIDEDYNRHKIAKQIIHNFSSYTLTDIEIKALSFGLDHPLPLKVNRTNISTEFEYFYRNLLNDISDLPDIKLREIKTKLRNTCEKYCKVKMPYQFRTVIDNLAKRKDITILKQDKGRGVVILDRGKYTEKCFNLLNTEQFRCLNEDPTKSTEAKIQRTLRKIESTLTKQEYFKLYPSGSSPGKFYGTAKLHKIGKNGNINDLPLRPIVSNIGTATYHLAKHLSKVLSPLRNSEYTIKNTKDFLVQLKKEKIPKDHQMVSFDVKSLFTNVPLEKTIDIILRRIYHDKEININITKKDMRDLLLLCTKNVHFTFEGKIYIQIDGVAMGSPLAPVLADIFMVELERIVVPTLATHLRFWRRYVDDTICFVKTGSIEYILSVINNFHEKIQFTYEIEKDSKISFLAVEIQRTNETLATTVYRKETNNDMYLNWNSFSPDTWKRSTFRTLIERAYVICSTPKLRRKEINHLKYVFRHYNNYPMWVINQIIKQVEHKHTQQNLVDNIAENNEPSVENKKPLLLLPYHGKKR